MTTGIEQRNGNNIIYRYGNWVVSNVGGFSPGYGEYPSDNGAITITSNDGDPAYELRNTDDVYTAEQGQTVEVVVDCKESTEDKPFIVAVSLGTFIESFYIFPNKITFITANNTEFNVTPGKHRYTLSINDEKAVFYIDKTIVYIKDYTVASKIPSLGRSILIGYDTSGAPGTGITDVYYVKSTSGAKKYVLLENVDFELEIDSKTSFDSTKKHHYSKADFYVDGTLTISDLTQGLHGRIYGVKCTTNNRVVGNLIPCKRNVDSVLGFFNVTDNFFYDVAGITDFGPEITDSQVPEDYTALEYLTFTGTQQVITQIPVNLSSSVEISLWLDTNYADTEQLVLTAKSADNKNVQTIKINEKCAVYTNNVSSATSKQLLFDKKCVFYSTKTTLAVNGAVYSIIYKPWDPISYTCGSFDSTTSAYNNIGLVSGCNIQLPERTSPNYIPYYYRVRTFIKNIVAGETVYEYSAWAYNSKEEPEHIITINTPEAYLLSDSDKQFYSFIPTDDGFKVLLPNTHKAGWKTYINNDGNYDLKVVYNDIIFDETTQQPQTVEKVIQIIKPKEAYNFTQSYTKWLTELVTSQQYFMLYPNNTNNIFSDTYYKRLPAESYVYSKDGESGVIAGLFRSYANEVDLQIVSHNKLNRYLDVAAMTPTDITAKYADIFNIDNNLCKNELEKKDLYLKLVKSQHLQTTKQGISDVILAVTGVRPTIHELYDLQSWTPYTLRSSVGAVPVVLASSDNASTEESEETAIQVDDNKVLYYQTETDFYLKDPYLPEKDKRYYLVDHNNSSRTYKPAVIWDAVDKAFTVVIDVYDSYNLFYGITAGSTSKLTPAYKELIKSIVKLFKPAHLKTYIRFYNAEGVIDEEHHWYYTYDAYNEAFFSQNKVETNA